MKIIIITTIKFIYAAILMSLSLLSLVLLFYIYIRQKRQTNTLLHLLDMDYVKQRNIISSDENETLFKIHKSSSENLPKAKLLTVFKTIDEPNILHINYIYKLCKNNMLSFDKFYDARIYQKIRISYSEWCIAEEEKLIKYLPKLLEYYLSQNSKR